MALIDDVRRLQKQMAELRLIVGSSMPLFGFADQVPVVGAADGTNGHYKLPHIPVLDDDGRSSLMLIVDNLIYTRGAYTQSGVDIWMNRPPASGGTVRASYRYNLSRVIAAFDVSQIERPPRREDDEDDDGARRRQYYFNPGAI